MRLQNSPLALKVLTALLYDYPADTEWEGLQARIRLSSIAKVCKTKNDRVKEALRTLHDVGYIEALEFTTGFSKLRLATPGPIKRLLQ